MIALAALAAFLITLYLIELLMKDHGLVIIAMVVAFCVFVAVVTAI